MMRLEVAAFNTPFNTAFKQGSKATIRRIVIHL